MEHTHSFQHHSRLAAFDNMLLHYLTFEKNALTISLILMHSWAFKCITNKYIRVSFRCNAFNAILMHFYAAAFFHWCIIDAFHGPSAFCFIKFHLGKMHSIAFGCAYCIMLHLHAYNKYRITEKFHLRSFCDIAHMQWPQAFFEHNILKHFKPFASIWTHSNSLQFIRGQGLCQNVYICIWNAQECRLNAS